MAQDAESVCLQVGPVKVLCVPRENATHNTEARPERGTWRPHDTQLLGEWPA